MHPLDEAYFRLDWAKKRLEELKSAYAVYVDEETEIIRSSIKASINPQTGNPQIHYPTNTGHLIPVKIPILIGEVAYHLRASLDYLVYRLAILDSGSEQKGTQFPVESTLEGFRGRRNKFLNGLNDTHAKAIERLQPYNGVEWTKWLVIVSNPDKHRHLVVSSPQKAVRVRHGTNPPTDRADAPGLYVTLELTDKIRVQRMYVQFHILPFISFENGLVVIDGLEEIESEIRDKLAYFKASF